MPFLIPAISALVGWAGGMFTSDGLDKIFWLGLLALTAYIVFMFWG